MFCRNCGAEIKDDWKICPNCGKEIVRNNENTGQVSQQEKSDTKKSKKKIIVGAIIGVIVVVSVGIAYGVNANKTKSTQPKTTTASKKGKKTKEIKNFSNQDFVHMAHPNGRLCGAKRPKCEAERSSPL